MIYEVYKKFQADPGELTPGDLVETSGWHNEAALIRQGYIGTPRKPESELKKATVLQDGRVVFARNMKTEEVKRPAMKKTRGRKKKSIVPPKGD